MAAYTELQIAGLHCGGSAWGRSDSQIDLFNRTDRVLPTGPAEDGSHVYRITVGELKRRLNAIGYTPQSVEASVRDVARALLKDLPKDPSFAESRSFLQYARSQSAADLIELVRAWRERATRNDADSRNLFDVDRTTDFPTALLELIRGGSPLLALVDYCPMPGHAFECLLCEVFDADDVFEFGWTCVADSEGSPETFDPIGQRYDEILSSQNPNTFVRGSIVAQEEGDRWEFKTVSPGNAAKSIANLTPRYAVGFLNRYGGTMLFGVADDGTVEGVSIRRDQRDELDRLVKAALLTITPAIPLGEFTIEFRPVVGAANVLPDCYVVELKIPVGKPDDMYFQGESTWVRIGKETRSLTGHALFAHIFATYRCGRRKVRER